MPQRSYDLELAMVITASGHAEHVLLTADVDGETLVVENIVYLSSAGGRIWTRRYVNSVLVNEWLDPNRATTWTTNEGNPGPFVLIGSSAAPQEFRFEMNGAINTSIYATAHFSRE